MKIIGILMLVGGLIGLIVGFNIDTTVASGTSGGRVHNIGLMNDKQNLLLVSSAISVVGAILVGFGSRAKPNVTSRPSTLMPPQERKCPFCAERIKVEATVCRYCQRELPPVDNFAAAAHPAGVVAPVAPDISVSKLVALGCRVTHPSEEKWEVLYPSGVTAYAYSAESLQKIAMDYSQRREATDSA